MNTTKIMREAKRLDRLGFSIIWLHRGSKRPVESAWTKGPKKTFQELLSSYQNGMNIGVRLGRASQIKNRGFLAVLDVDVKSQNPAHVKEAYLAARKALKGAACPIVSSGRSNGSRHYYFITREPISSFNGERSGALVKVLMPSAEASKKGTQGLTEAEITQGYRVRPAWEISVMSEGRQVVLPPSIHPDTGRPYVWRGDFTDTGQLPIIEFDYIKDVEKRAHSPLVADGQTPTKVNGVEERFEFEPVEVDLNWLDLSERVRKGITLGEGVEDRSAFLLPASSALISAGLSVNEVLSVLTDPKLYIGACAYEHAKTKERVRAARWVWRYTLKRVSEERDAVLLFKNAAKITPNKTLSESEKEKQDQAMESGLNWHTQLERSENGRYRNSFLNCRLIIENAAGGAPVGRDEFAINDFYVKSTPWGTKKGQALTDIDIIRIKSYCVSHYGIEFSNNTINDALLEIADQNRFHPVRDWLKSLKWDGKERIHSWLKDFAGAAAPEPYLSDVSRKFLIAMVARIFKPGIKFDTILILEGNQGTGKSTLLEKLVGEEWFTDAPLRIGDKDAVLTIQSKWLVELGELSSMSKADLEAFKVFIAQKTDRIRAPYGKRVEEFPRQLVFAGTTNLEEYLRDLTGNRRFWTVNLTAEQINFDGIAKIRSQLFAEAYQHFILGEEIYLTDLESSGQAIAEQARRVHSDEWIGAVSDIVNSEAFPLTCFEMRDVAKRLDQFGAHRLSPSDVHRITRCLKILGFEKFQESGGHRRKLWRATRGFTPMEGNRGFTPIEEMKNGHGNGHGNDQKSGLNGTARNRVEPRGAVPPKAAPTKRSGVMEPWNHDLL